MLIEYPHKIRKNFIISGSIVFNPPSTILPGPNKNIDELVTSASVSAQKTGWMMYINFINSGSKLLSTKSFKKLNIVELYVQMKKVIKRGSKVNELMRSFIEERFKDIGVQAF